MGAAQPCPGHRDKPLLHFLVLRIAAELCSLRWGSLWPASCRAPSHLLHLPASTGGETSGSLNPAEQPLPCLAHRQVFALVLSPPCHAAEAVLSRYADPVPSLKVPHVQQKVGAKLGACLSLGGREVSLVPKASPTLTVPSPQERAREQILLPAGTAAGSQGGRCLSPWQLPPPCNASQTGHHGPARSHPWPVPTCLPAPAQPGLTLH